MQCDNEFQELLAERLGSFARSAADATDARAAAVAVTVVDGGHGAGCNGLPHFEDWQSHAALILTRRSSRLRNHAGQWAFPGGRIDPGETPARSAGDAEAAAVATTSAPGLSRRSPTATRPPSPVSTSPIPT